MRFFPRIAGDGSHAATQLCQELAACAVDGAQRFDSHRDKIMSGRKVRIFGSFSVRCVLCCASRRYPRQVDIGGRARVDGCCVPSRGRPKFGFGFGFGAESWQMASFGIVSVSAEGRKLPFGFLSVSAETDIDLRSSAEGLL